MCAKPVVLLLAGDLDEAGEIADRLMATRRLTLMVAEPAALGRIPADVTRGEFASAAAMAEMLEWDRVRVVVDASDPFDPVTPALAADACHRAGVARLRMLRPGWEDPGGRRCVDLVDAARALPLAGRAFLAVRPQDADAFAVRRDIWYLLRVHRAVGGRFPLRRGDFALGAPPFTEAHERQLLGDYRIGAVVAQDTGLEEGLPLIAAAWALGLPLLIVDRPEPPRGPVAASPLEVVEWVLGKL